MAGQHHADENRIETRQKGPPESGPSTRVLFGEWNRIMSSRVLYEQAAGVAVHTVLTRFTILPLVNGAAPCCFTEVSL